MRVIIVGGGVGGLTTALALHARGIKAVVCEQASEIKQLGVGINTLPHAIKELADLGLLDALDAVGIRTSNLIYRQRPGKTSSASRAALMPDTMFRNSRSIAVSCNKSCTTLPSNGSDGPTSKPAIA